MVISVTKPFGEQVMKVQLHGFVSRMFQVEKEEEKEDEDEREEVL